MPKFYWEAYRRNCKSQLQNLSGISVGGAHRLFSSIIDIELCLAASQEEGVPYPLKPGVQRIPVSADDSMNIWDYLNHKAFLTRVLSRVQPRRHPTSLRYAHLDLATQTLAGLAICHLAGAQLVDGLVRNGEPFSEYRLIVEYDFILTICAGETKPINIEKIQRFFFWLRDMCGYQFGLITADTWQSEAPLQMLEARNFKVEKLSIDRDKSVYTTWRAGFEEHRIRLHRNEQMLREAEQLLEMDKKYDHPPDGCFTGDTEVKLLNGTSLSLAEMAKRGGTYWVYGNNEAGKVIPVKAFNARKTKTVNTVLEITLDNNKTVRCTPDHRFLTRSGVYVRADQLTCGTRLMPLYTKLYKIKYRRGTGCYEQVWSEGNWRMTHKLVAEYRGFPARDGEVIQHTSLNSLNNDPDLLERLTVSEHNRRHVLISKATSDPEVVKRRIATFKRRYSHNVDWLRKKSEIGVRIQAQMTDAQKIKHLISTRTPEARERSRLHGLKRWADPVHRLKMLEVIKAGTRYMRSAEGRQNSSKRAAQTNHNHRPNWSPERLRKHCQNVQAAMRLKQQRDDAKALKSIELYRPYLLGVYHAIHLTGGGGNYTWHRRLAGTDWATNAEKLRGLSIEKMCQLTGLNENSLREHLRHLKKYDIITFNNHKVVSVRCTTGTFDVYDLSIEGPYENFALMAGISVHNSKDTIDAAAGCFFDAVNSDEKLTISSSNAPGVYGGSPPKEEANEKPPVEINLPQHGYERVRIFEG